MGKGTLGGAAPAHDTGGADAGGVLTGPRVDDGVDEDLDRVAVGGEVDDVEGVLHDAGRHQLLAVVAAVHHEGACQPAQKVRGSICGAVAVAMQGQ